MTFSEVQQLYSKINSGKSVEQALAEMAGIERRQNGDAVTPSTKGEANESVDKQKRYKQILEVLEGNQLTAKEIAVEMHERGYIPTSERNFTAPRLTELSHNGVVELIGKKKCQYTGKTVAVYKIREQQVSIFG